MPSGRIRAGIGGWTFEPWRGVFYPAGLRQADELAYAASRLTAIEINGTYYSAFKPESFAKWAQAAPDGFKFAVKASRFCTNRKVLAEGEKSVSVFVNQGIVELGDRLGPILWQFMATKRYDEADFEGFLSLLPKSQGGVALQHVLEVRHASFADPAFVAQCRRHGVAICCSENESYPAIPDVTAGLVYVRLMKGSDAIDTGYRPADLDLWADRLRTYAAGGRPADLAAAAPEQEAPVAPREVFAFFIHEGKVRAPAAALEMIRRIDGAAG